MINCIVRASERYIIKMATKRSARYDARISQTDWLIAEFAHASIPKKFKIAKQIYIYNRKNIKITQDKQLRSRVIRKLHM